jgi:hypothetical protein
LQCGTKQTHTDWTGRLLAAGGILYYCMVHGAWASEIHTSMQRIHFHPLKGSF